MSEIALDKTLCFSAKIHVAISEHAQELML